MDDDLLRRGIATNEELLKTITGMIPAQITTNAEEEEDDDWDDDEWDEDDEDLDDDDDDDDDFDEEFDEDFDDDDDDDDDWLDDISKSDLQSNPFNKTYSCCVEATDNKRITVELVFVLASRKNAYYTIPGVVKATFDDGTLVPAPKLGYYITDKVMRSVLESLLWIWEEDEEFQTNNPGLGLLLQEQLK